MRTASITCLLLSAALSACVDTGPPAPQIDPAYVEKNQLSAAPAQMTNVVNADFGGKVVYLGNDVEHSTVAPGEEARVVHYWKVLQPPGERWRVFSHLVGSKKADWSNIDRSDMRLGYGPDKWQAGDIIRDEHVFRIPKGWKSPYAEVALGLYPKGGHAITDRMPVVTGTADEERRVHVARIEVSGAGAGKAASEPKLFAVRKTGEAITVDGRADEDVWKRATESPVFTAAEGSPAMKGETRAKLLWDDEFLYAFVEAEDEDVHSQYTENDSDMWREDVVELFIDADGNRRGYIELQVNPHNAQFDAWFATTRGGPSDKAWSANMKSAVAIDGSLAERGDDKGWSVEIAIPLVAVRGAAPSMRVNVPPQVGDTWKLNIVRLDKPEDEKNPAVASWNQISYQDFHALDRMLGVVFADETGNTTPAPVTEPENPAQDEAANEGQDPAAADKSDDTSGAAGAKAEDKAGAADKAKAGAADKANAADKAGAKAGPTPGN